MMLNVPTLEEAPCCYKWVAVYDLGLGQVHLMACEPYMLCQSRCSRISFLECPWMFTEALLQGSARLSNIHLSEIPSHSGLFNRIDVGLEVNRCVSDRVI